MSHVDARTLAIGGLLAATVAGVGMWNPGFLGLRNVIDLLVQAAPVIMIASALTLVLVGGEIDISVGSLYGLSAALLGVLSSPSHAGWPAPFAVVAVVGAGAAVGGINAVLVVYGRVPSIIATLGMMTLLRGVTETILGGSWITDIPAGVRWLGTGDVLGVPVCLWVAGAVATALGVILRSTRLGLRLRAVGGNPEAASVARIASSHVKVTAFVVLGAVTALAASVCVPQQSVIDSGIGSGLELVAVTAVLVGGTSIRGGRGEVAGTVIAALLLGCIRTAIVFLQLPPIAAYWERAVQGGFILVSIALDRRAASKGEEPR